jgi:hypothetical protein
MAAWSQQQQQNSDEVGDATKGIIVNGALAAFHVDEAKVAANHVHSWISQEEMRRICPKIKLADYQLIGVNWLALLHGMRVDVGGSKDTNVNGVLADVMVRFPRQFRNMVCFAFSDNVIVVNFFRVLGRPFKRLLSLRGCEIHERNSRKEGKTRTQLTLPTLTTKQIQMTPMVTYGPI